MKQAGLLRQIANRYLFSKKSHSVINIISIVSALSISVPVAAMIILLSVHNGLSDFIIRLDSSFEPALKVVTNEGRFFELSEAALSELSDVEGVSAISKVIESDILLEYKGKYTFLTARGVDSLFPQVIPIKDHLIRGEWNTHGAFMGLTTVYEITQGGAIENSIRLHVPQTTVQTSFIPIPLYRSSDAELSGIYSLDTDTELTYLLVPLETTEELVNRPGMTTAIFIKADSAANLKTVRSNVEKWAETQDKNLRITTQKEENKSQYEVLRQEKFAVFIILTLVILVASFTLIGAVVMLMIEKEEEARLLNILGLRKTEVKRIFVLQGMMLSSYGIALGTLIGVGVSLLQQKYGFVKIEGSSPLLDSYPVIVSAADTLMIIATVFALSFLIVIFTVKINKFTDLKNG